MKMSSRERMLSMAMGGIVFVLLNLWLLSTFAQRNLALRAELADRQIQWTAMQELLSEQSLWAGRDAALSARQPKLGNENAAGVELLDLVKGMAAKHNVKWENEVFGGVVKNTSYRSVPVMMDTHSSWPDLIGFLYALQKPDQFIVCESANIQVDPGDPTRMLGHFKIARWYAP